MGWKKDFSSLRQRLIQKSKSAGAVDKQVQRLANKLSLTPEEALFVLAKQKGISYQTSFRKLTKEQQSRVGQTLSSSSGSVTNIVHRTTSTTRTSRSWHEKWWGFILTNVVAGLLVGLILWLIFGRR